MVRCMKCGKRIEQGSFCSECLAVMERYPVRPRTKVIIPERKPIRRAPRRQRSPEEIMASQRRIIRNLIRTVLMLTLLLAVAVGVIAWRLYQERDMAPLGSNYYTVETVEETAPPIE